MPLVYLDNLLAGNIARALSIYPGLMRSDPDNAAVAKAFKIVKALDSGKDKGNAAFKAGQFQHAYDECAPLPAAHVCMPVVDPCHCAHLQRTK